MSEWHISAYWKRREEAEAKRRASTLYQEIKSEIEGYKGQQEAHHREHVAAIERIADQGDAAAHRAETNEDRHETWEWRRFWLEIGGVAIALIAAGILYGQQVVMQGQLTAMKIADRTTKESFTAVQRAFVFGKQLIVKKDPMPPYWRFAVLVTNSGNTPTQAMDYLAVFGQDSPGDPEDIFVNTPKYIYGSPPATIQRRSGDLLGPHEDFILLTSNVGLPAFAIASMAEKRQHFYFSGVIHYRDVFRDTRDHITKYCYAAVPYKDGIEIKVGIQRCLYWNCADEDCKDDRTRFDHDIAVLNGGN
jgi:hypothetical protein